MYVKQLTITPINKSMTKTIFRNPNAFMASQLIKERLIMGNSIEQRVPRALKKLPKHLAGWVNPETLVANLKFFA